MRTTVYDTDVHHNWGSPQEIAEYLPARWQPYLRQGELVRPIVTPVATYSRLGGITDRLDAIAPEGKAPGSSYELMREQLLDRYDINRVLLTFAGFSEAGHPNSHFAADLCRAANDWTVDRWLDRGDERLYGVAMLPMGSPTATAEEIRRMAGHPRIAGLSMSANPLGKPFGDCVFDPVYEAAEEVGLPLVVHVGVDFSSGNAAFASGLPTSRIDQFSQLDQGPIHHLVSMICGGVLQRYPGLRLLFNECGFSQLPALLWSLDAYVDVLAAESPGLERLPSEYFMEHFWVSSQPFDCETAPENVIALMRSFPGLEERICFSSDYPHHDSESPAQVAARLPREWREGVMWRNAAALFGWSPDAPVGVAEAGVIA